VLPDCVVPTLMVADTSNLICELGSPVPGNDTVSPGEAEMIFTFCAAVADGSITIISTQKIIAINTGLKILAFTINVSVPSADRIFYIKLNMG
jgi:hypothetical protein